MVSVPKVYPGDMVFWHCVSSLVQLVFFMCADGRHRMLFMRWRRSTLGKKTRQ